MYNEYMCPIKLRYMRKTRTHGRGRNSLRSRSQTTRKLRQGSRTKRIHWSAGSCNRSQRLTDNSVPIPTEHNTF